jgi:hypothetical protein
VSKGGKGPGITPLRVTLPQTAGRREFLCSSFILSSTSLDQWRHEGGGLWSGGLTTVCLPALCIHRGQVQLRAVPHGLQQALCRRRVSGPPGGHHGIRRSCPLSGWESGGSSLTGGDSAVHGLGRHPFGDIAPSVTWDSFQMHSERPPMESHPDNATLSVPGGDAYRL